MVRPGGILIAFEGGDAVGKGTQISMLAAHYNEKEPNSVVVIRHPGEGVLNTELRKTLLRNDGTRHTLMAETLIFAADLANMTEWYIKPALAAGKIVLIDRHLLSSIVYQGHCDGVDLDFVEEISMKAASRILPDFTFVLDADPEITMARKAHLPTDGQYEAKIDVQRKVREGYVFEAKKRANVYLISANQAMHDVHQDILDVLQFTV